MSGRMIRSAAEKSAQVSWYQADAADLPFRDGAFDGVTSTLALHHFSDHTQVFQEVSRVLRRGKFVIFTTTPEQMSGYWLNSYVLDTMARSIEQMPSLEAVETTLAGPVWRSATPRATR